MNPVNRVSMAPSTPQVTAAVASTGVSPESGFAKVASAIMDCYVPCPQSTGGKAGGKAGGFLVTLAKILGELENQQAQTK